MKSQKRKWLVRLLIVLVCTGLSAGAVFAYLSSKSGSVNNTFTPETERNPSISETFEDNVKTDVKVNVGDLDYAVYVRAAIVVVWKNNDGEVYGQMPEAGKDYEIHLNVGQEAPWFQQGNFYYCRDRVDTGETAILIHQCKPLVAAPTGYYLHVEIVAQTVQAVGTTDVTDIPAVTAAWGIRVDTDGRLFHTVIAVAGDTWESLSAKYGVDPNDLATLNGQTTSAAIVAGQTILLPNLP